MRGLSSTECMKIGMMEARVVGSLVITSEWFSQIFDITQAMASLTLA